MTKTKKRSKQQSESDSSSSSSSSESDNKHKKSKTQSKSKPESKGKDEKPTQSIWDSPRNQAQTSRHEEKRRERRRSHDGDNRDTSRHRNNRDEERKHDSNRGKRSPERRDDHRRNRQSPQERRRHEESRPESRDSRDDRRDNDRRKRSNSRERPSYNDRRGGGGRGGGGGRFNKQRRFNNKEEDDANFEWGKRDIKQDPEEPPVEKDKPNFGLSGKLTEETNKVNGIVIKYAEPPEAKQPKRRWRLYPFKGETALPTLYIHRQSAFLIGRDRKICDIAVDHPSCSKQHAALQFRLVPYEREDGTTGKRVRPYIIDLESANGTFLNNKQIEAKKYVELLEKDVIKFGFSSREYVMLHEASKDEAEDDEVADEPETGSAAN